MKKNDQYCYSSHPTLEKHVSLCVAALKTTQKGWILGGACQFLAVWFRKASYPAVTRGSGGIIAMHLS